MCTAAAAVKWPMLRITNVHASGLSGKVVGSGASCMTPSAFHAHFSYTIDVVTKSGVKILLPAYHSIYASIGLRDKHATDAEAAVVHEVDTYPININDEKTTSPSWDNFQAILPDLAALMPTPLDFSVSRRSAANQPPMSLCTASQPGA